MNIKEYENIKQAFSRLSQADTHKIDIGFMVFEHARKITNDDFSVLSPLIKAHYSVEYKFGENETINEYGNIGIETVELETKSGKKQKFVNVDEFAMAKLQSLISALEVMAFYEEAH